jgi:hypothetical protein
MAVCAKYFLIQPLLGFLGPFYILHPLIWAAKLLHGKPCILEQTVLNKSCRSTLMILYILSVLPLLHLLETI